MKPSNNRGFSTLPALVTGRTLQRLGNEAKDKQLATAGVMLEQRARIAQLQGQPTLPPSKTAPPAAALPSQRDPDEVWGEAGISALQELKAERA